MDAPKGASTVLIAPFKIPIVGWKMKLHNTATMITDMTCGKKNTMRKNLAPRTPCVMSAANSSASVMMTMGWVRRMMAL